MEARRSGRAEAGEVGKHRLAASLRYLTHSRQTSNFRKSTHSNSILPNSFPILLHLRRPARALERHIFILFTVFSIWFGFRSYFFSSTHPPILKKSTWIIPVVPASISPPARRDLALDTLAHSFVRETGFPMMCYTSSFSSHRQCRTALLGQPSSNTQRPGILRVLTSPSHLDAS